MVLQKGVKINQLKETENINAENQLIFLSDINNNTCNRINMSNFIDNLISSNNDNGLKKDIDNKLHVINTTNADNIISGILPLDRLADSGVEANTYNFPEKLVVDNKGRITSIKEGTPGTNNADKDLSNITTAGREVIRENSFARNIGEIVTSTIPLTDAGLHLADGSLLQYGSYSAFIDYMAELSTSNPNLFCTEVQWQETVTKYGVCGKFVYDSTNKTVRLPKITGFIQGNLDASALGEIVEAGLPNITSATKILSQGGSVNNGCLKDIEIYSTFDGRAYSVNQALIDASKSNPIYKDNFNKVQPQSINVYYYIVVATSTKTDVQVNIDNVMTDLNGKADVDGTNMISNLSAVAKDYFSKFCVPDYVASVKLSANTEYKALTNGFIYANCSGLYGGGYRDTLQVNNIVIDTSINSNEGFRTGMSCYVAKGDTYRFTIADITSWNIKFCPLKGAD